MTSRGQKSRFNGTRPGWLVPVGVFIAATLVASWATGPYLVGVFHDDGVYALLAQSLATGHGMHYSHLSGNPAAVHYPPVYPLLLSLLWRLAPTFPDNVSVLLGFNALLVGIAAAGLWFFATRREHWRSAGAAAASLACTLGLPTLALAGALLSETLFLALLWPALLMSEKAAEQDESVREQAATGVVIGVLVLVRTHAVALLAAAIIVLLARRRFRQAAVVGASAIGVQLPWVLWTWVATPRVAQPLEGAYGSYLGWFVSGLRDGGAPFVTATIGRNVAESWLYFGDRFAAGFPPILAYMVLGAVIVAFGIGAWRLWSRARVTLLFLAFYLAIVLVWPYNPWRFVWAVWPLIAFLILTGFHWAWQLGGRRRMIAMALAVLPVAAFLRVELHAYATRDWRSSALAGAAQIIPVLGWAHANVSPSDVILSEGEPVLALYEGIHAEPPASFTAREYLLPPAGAEGAARLMEMMRAVNARYVILFNPGMIRSAMSLRERHPGLVPVQRFPAGVAFQVTP